MKNLFVIILLLFSNLCFSQKMSPSFDLGCDTTTNKTVFIKTINGVNCGCYTNSLLLDTIPSINCILGPCDNFKLYVGESLISCEENCKKISTGGSLDEKDFKQDIGCASFFVNEGTTGQEIEYCFNEGTNYINLTLSELEDVIISGYSLSSGCSSDIYDLSFSYLLNGDTYEWELSYVVCSNECIKEGTSFSWGAGWNGGADDIIYNAERCLNVIKTNEGIEYCDDNGNVFEDCTYLSDCQEETSTVEVEVKPTTEVCYISPDAENGIRGYRWDDNAIAFSDNPFTSATTHGSGDADDEITITNNWNVNDLDFANTSFAVSQESYRATLCVDKPTEIRDVNGNWGELIDFYVRDCNKDWVKKAATYTATSNRSLGEFYCLPKGCTDIVININDFSVYGGFNLQYYDSVADNWSAFPMDDTYTYQPETFKATVYVNEDGTFENLDGTAFTFKTIDCDIPCYPVSREPVSSISVDIENACFDVDGNPDNYINVTQETIFKEEDKTVTYYTDFGGDNETEIAIGEYVFIDCLTGEPIEEPQTPVNCESTVIVNAYAPQGEQGINIEYWDNLTETYSQTDQAGDIFNGAVDYSGLPAINSNETPTLTLKEPDLFIRDPINGQNAYRGWTYVFLPKAARIREFHPTAESINYYDGKCQTPSVYNTSGEYLNNTLPSDFDDSYAAGIHYLGFTTYDFSVWGTTRYQYSDDNGTTWKNIPKNWLYCKEPTLSVCQVQLCTKPSGIKVLTDAETCFELGPEYSLKKPSLCSGEIAVATEPKCELVDYVEYSNITNTLRNREWDLGPRPRVFMSVDDGTTIRTNFDFTLPTTIDGDWLNLNVNDTNSDANVQDAQIIEGYILVPTATEIRYTGNSAGYIALDLGACCGTEYLQLEGATIDNNVNPTASITIPTGVHFIRLWNIDDWSNTSRVLQVSTDGGATFVNKSIPDTWKISRVKPTMECKKGYFCDGVLYNADETEIIEIDNLTKFWKEIKCTEQKDPCCGTSYIDEVNEGSFDCVVSNFKVDTTTQYFCEAGEKKTLSMTLDTIILVQECFDVPDIKEISDSGDNPNLVQGWNADFYSSDCPIYGDFRLCYTYDYDNIPSNLSIVNLGPKGSFWGNFGNYQYNYEVGNNDRDWKLPRVDNVSVTGWLQYQQIGTCEVCMERVGDNIEYFHDGNSVYSGTTVTTGAVYLNVSLYGHNNNVWGTGEINLFDFELCPTSNDVPATNSFRRITKGLTDKEAIEIMEADGLTNQEIKAATDIFDIKTNNGKNNRN